MISQGVPEQSSYPTIILAGGCFWCLQAVFRELRGVVRVVSGYTGGHTPHPTYQEVCSGATHHAEAVAVTFDPGKLSLRDVLAVFFASHDPTTLNRQGHDIGSQYRSAIFYLDEEQTALIEQYIAELEQAKRWPHPIVTEVIPAGIFYPAAADHQHYYTNHPAAPYCQYVIAPKLAHVRKVCADLWRRDS